MSSLCSRIAVFIIGAFMIGAGVGAQPPESEDEVVAKAVEADFTRLIRLDA